MVLPLTSGENLNKNNNGGVKDWRWFSEVFILRKLLVTNFCKVAYYPFFPQAIHLPVRQNNHQNPLPYSH